MNREEIGGEDYCICFDKVIHQQVINPGNGWSSFEKSLEEFQLALPPDEGDGFALAEDGIRQEIDRMLDLLIELRETLKNLDE